MARKLSTKRSILTRNTTCRPHNKNVVLYLSRHLSADEQLSYPPLSSLDRAIYSGLSAFYTTGMNIIPFKISASKRASGFGRGVYGSSISNPLPPRAPLLKYNDNQSFSPRRAKIDDTTVARTFTIAHPLPDLLRAIIKVNDGRAYVRRALARTLHPV